MPGINTKVSASTFQQCDGSNFSTAGLDVGIAAGRGSVGVYGGIGTSFTGGSTGVIFDIKGSVPYGNSPLSGGFRVRHNINGNSKTVQFRFQPATVNIPVGDKTKIYATPYVATKVNYKTGKADTSIGCFAGVSQKLGKASVFLEGQIYDASHINAGTTSVNAGVSIPL